MEPRTPAARSRSEKKNGNRRTDTIRNTEQGSSSEDKYKGTKARTMTLEAFYCTVAHLPVHARMHARTSTSSAYESSHNGLQDVFPVCISTFGHSFTSLPLPFSFPSLPSPSLLPSFSFLFLPLLLFCLKHQKIARKMLQRMIKQGNRTKEECMTMDWKVWNVEVECRKRGG